MRQLFLSLFLIFSMLSCSDSSNETEVSTTSPQNSDELTTVKVTFPDSINYLTNNIVGRWIDTIDTVNYFAETWSQLNDSVFTADSYQYMEGNPTWGENVELSVRNDTIWYAPLTSGQNEGKRVYFALQSATNNEFVFVNYQHDWPQEIAYHFLHQDSLYITVGGPNKEKPTEWRTIDFSLFR